MKTNFDITLPSIPGKMIKLKIQDMKNIAFGSQKVRFTDNKSFLTKKFVQSFHGFHQAKHDDETQTQAQSQCTRTFSIERKSLPFRHIISENKKHLFNVINDLKDEKLTKINDSQKRTKGYSFSRAPRRKQQPNVQQEKGYQSENNQQFSDNYYFEKKSRASSFMNSKRSKPSAVFKNESRERAIQRVNKTNTPGPGAYLPLEKSPKKPSSKKITKQAEVIDYKHLKNLIEKVLVEKTPVIQEQQQQAEKELKPDHMFVQDDRDRFGNQIFPIAPKLKVPGPGTYQIQGTIQEKTKKLMLVQEQRKLLKDWFNN